MSFLGHAISLDGFDRPCGGTVVDANLAGQTDSARFEPPVNAAQRGVLILGVVE